MPVIIRLGIYYLEGSLVVEKAAALQAEHARAIKHASDNPPQRALSSNYSPKYITITWPCLSLLAFNYQN